MSVFPDRTESAIRGKIDSEWRRWRRKEHDPTPELDVLRRALFRPEQVTESDDPLTGITSEEEEEELREHVSSDSDDGIGGEVLFRLKCP